MGPPPADPLAEQPWVCSQSFPSPNAEGLSQTKSCTAWLPARLPSWMWPEPLAAGGQPPSRAELWDGEEGCFRAPCARCQGSDGAEHPRARAAPGEVALPLLFSVPVPCPTGPQLFPLHGARVHCVRPESSIKQNVYACLCSDEHLGRLARSLLSAAAPAAPGCRPPLPGDLGKGLRGANFRSVTAFSGWSPPQECPPSVPAPPAPL